MGAITRIWKRLRSIHRDNPQLVWGGLLIGCLLLLCIIALFYPYNEIVARNKLPKNQYPSFSYLLGTDSSGQSLLILLTKGTEAFFLPGLLATLIALLGGITLGSIGGYFGKFWGNVSSYISTLINSFPNLILVLLCVSIFGRSMTVVAIAIGITFIPHIADEIRRKVMQLKAEDFVLAAKAHGLNHFRILFYHILWLHCAPLVLRQLVYLWAALIILESSLNYIGKGILQKGFSWGKLLYDYRDGFFAGHFWSPFVVLAFLMLSMTGLFLLAEGLQVWGKNIGRKKTARLGVEE